MRTRDAIDEEVQWQWEAVMVEHPAYGHTRIALHLNMGDHCMWRGMNKYGLKPYRRRARHPNTPDDRAKPPTSYPTLLAPLLGQQRIM
jgi:hypothetical protein